MRGFAHNELSVEMDRFCSDKGTHWKSRHHYTTAYHSLLGPVRPRLRNFVEIGIGDDVAPSIAAWSTYLSPDTNIYALDIATPEALERRKQSGALQKQIHTYKISGCKVAPGFGRVKVTLDTDATKREDIEAADLPDQADVILDDGSHLVNDQQVTLDLLWEKLSPGGFYIIEDLFVGSVPWRKGHELLAPTNNTLCGWECYYPQRLFEHPLMYDRFNVAGPEFNKPPLMNTTERILKENDWFWLVTGVHRGGGLDCAIVIRKAGELPMPIQHAELPVSVSVAMFAVSCITNAALAVWMWSRRRHYTRIPRD